MATETIRKGNTAEIWDNDRNGPQSDINRRLTTPKGTGTATTLTNYTGTNYYTFPADGLVYVRNDSGNNGAVQIQFADNTPTMLMGKAEGYFLLPVRAGWQARMIGNAYLAYYFRFTY